jgi:thymidine kinase
VPTIRSGGQADLEVIVGPMFSGKSEELIRHVKRAVIARRAVQVFKPAVDDRFGAEIVRCHDLSGVRA